MAQTKKKNRKRRKVRRQNYFHGSKPRRGNYGDIDKYNAAVAAWEAGEAAH